jgi:hypothetical protein
MEIGGTATVQSACSVIGGHDLKINGEEKHINISGLIRLEMVGRILQMILTRALSRRRYILFLRSVI